MLFNLFKIPAKLAFYFYCRKIIVNKEYLLKSKGPLLIAANHPNSFLDAVIVATLFKQPVYSLARGDAFVNNFYKKILYSFKMLPVYRISEGSKNLEHNYTTFSECLNIFKKDGTVLIFSEGLCKNEWHLRPLKKGTARLAISAWQQNIPLTVLPLGINYSSFRLFGKNVIVNFGEVITGETFNKDLADGRLVIKFNERLQQELKKLVIKIDPSDKKKRMDVFFIPQPLFKRLLLTIPSILGYIIHFPLYYSAVLVIRKRANDHYDSVVVGLLFLFYPLYIILLTIAVYLTTNQQLSWLLVIAIPFTAWSTLQLKRQVV